MTCTKAWTCNPKMLQKSNPESIYVQKPKPNHHEQRKRRSYGQGMPKFKNDDYDVDKSYYYVEMGIIRSSIAQNA